MSEKEYVVEWRLVTGGSTKVHAPSADYARLSVLNMTFGDLLEDSEGSDLEIEWIDEL